MDPDSIEPSAVEKKTEETTNNIPKATSQPKVNTTEKGGNWGWGWLNTAVSTSQQYTNKFSEGIKIYAKEAAQNINQAFEEFNKENEKNVSTNPVQQTPPSTSTSTSTSTNTNTVASQTISNSNPVNTNNEEIQEEKNKVDPPKTSFFPASSNFIQKSTQILNNSTDYLSKKIKITEIKQAATNVIESVEQSFVDGIGAKSIEAIENVGKKAYKVLTLDIEPNEQQKQPRNRGFSKQRHPGQKLTLFEATFDYCNGLAYLQAIEILSEEHGHNLEELVNQLTDEQQVQLVGVLAKIDTILNTDEISEEEKKKYNNLPENNLHAEIILKITNDSINKIAELVKSYKTALSEKRALKPAVKQNDQLVEGAENNVSVNPLEEECLLVLDLTLDNILKIQLESVKILAEFSAKCVEQIKLIVEDLVARSSAETKPQKNTEIQENTNEANKSKFGINEQKLGNVELLMPVNTTRQLLILLTNCASKIYEACINAVKEVSSYGKINLAELIPEGKINDVKVTVEIDAKLKSATANIYSESISSINYFQQANALSGSIFKHLVALQTLN